MSYILKKRINSAQKYLTSIEAGEVFYIVVNISSAHEPILRRIGAREGWVRNLNLLPSIIGPKTKFNQKGKYVLLKHLDKEEYTYFVKPKYYPNGTFRRGYYRTIQRYQREDIIAPQSIIICDEISGEKFIVSKPHIKNVDNYELIKHEINLVLEIFGNCQIVKDLFDLHNQPQVEYVDWEILPKGKYPWQINTSDLKKYSKLSTEEQIAIKNRHDYIEKYNPTKIYTGSGSFSDYCVFAFPQKNIYILESPTQGNATYIFNESWEEFSKLSKSELINNNLHSDRFIHNKSWSENIDAILK